MQRYKKRQTTTYTLPATSIGTRSTLLIHDYLPTGISSPEPHSLEWYGQERAYIQASLHADELPGLLVSHHLIKLLDVAASEGRIKKQISIVPYANPIGLNQVMQGKHFGRFNWMTGINFNRNWLDVTEKVAKRVEGELKTDDVKWNTAVIRKALYEEAEKVESNKQEVLWKKELYKKACVASIVLDLHCDLDAILHIYTHDRLWPELSDLAASLGSRCNLLSPDSGGNAFDESCSCPWSSLMDHFPAFPLEMACKSATVELRGRDVVYDEIALQDARNLYAFLTRRGYIEDRSIAPLTNLSEQVASPLTGADMVESTIVGLFAAKVKPGDIVVKGQLLGEIVSIEDVDAPRIPVISRTSGIVFGMVNTKYWYPGECIVYIAGNEPLDWRKEGSLMND